MKVEYVGPYEIEIEKLGKFRPGGKEVELTPEQQVVFLGGGFYADSEGRPIFKIDGKLQEPPKPPKEAKVSKPEEKKGGTK